MIVTHQHAKSFGLCNRGLRLWCKNAGVDYNDFRLNGISEDRLRALNDANAIELLRKIKNGL